MTRAIPIRRQLMRMMLITSSAMLLVTSSAFFAYELLTFRQTSVQQLNTLGEAIAVNSSAALAFDNPDDAVSVLAAFGADPHIVAAALYDRRGELFAVYPAGAARGQFPPAAETADEHRFERNHLIGFQPVTESGRRLGTLYVKSDLTAINERIRLYGWLVALVIGVAVLLAYVLSRRLQHKISGPILALSATATLVSTGRDYSVRVARTNTNELDQLTDAFNHMLEEVQQSEHRLRTQLGHLELLNHITSAIGDRQDMASIFNVVLQSLERNLPVDLACVLRHDAAGSLFVSSVGAASRAHDGALAACADLSLTANDPTLARCMSGAVHYESDASQASAPIFRELAAQGFASIVITPLLIKNSYFGLVLVARHAAASFSSGECHFLRQLSDHVALAAEQAQLYGALQQAYDDLRQTQHTVLQQERLRALGQMASGIAHDINNAISPVALYTESLLEREPNLSDRARSYLTTIQRAIDDVAGTVARMREFYREREPQLTLARIDLNGTIQQAIDLTHARWSDLPQQRGVVVELRTELSPVPAEVMAAEGELRDALTNLIFNAVDAMPEGGTLTLRTRCVASNGGEAGPAVHIEVSDTGIGMDEATRRRCLEPFFTTKGERGTGLGLAMVYGMVQRHSAELQVDSEPGRGTTFRLIFPGVTQEISATTRMPLLPVAVRRLRILLVDDDPTIIKSLYDILTTDGHLVTIANGGQAGIDAFVAAAGSATAFALVITDLGMPHVDGRKVATAVKQVSPGTPVIMLTGWGKRLIAENDMPADVDRVLAKPPRLQELRLALAELTAEEAAVST